MVSSVYDTADSIKMDPCRKVMIWHCITKVINRSFVGYFKNKPKKKGISTVECEYVIITPFLTAV
jgi:hypothetical protein